MYLKIGDNPCPRGKLWQEVYSYKRREVGLLFLIQETIIRYFCSRGKKESSNYMA